MKSSKFIRDLFSGFWESHSHTLLPPSPLVPKDDPTTLFTSAGMQQLVVNFDGSPHPLGKRLYNIQPCLRVTDIDEVGDNRHLTFFEMLGNWSLGDYFKEEQIAWYYEFLTKKLNLDKERLYASVYKGGFGVENDYVSKSIWKKLGFPDSKIFEYDASKNWWSRSGPPDKMPVGEIGGPSSEVFFDTGILHNRRYGLHCHPNCNCGRFIEIGNSVFLQYKKNKDKKIIELPQKNVDFGGGLERLCAVLLNSGDIYQTDLFLPMIVVLENILKHSYSSEYKKYIRIISDHIKAVCMIILEGVTPSNKAQGYVLRKLIRRSLLVLYKIAPEKISKSVFNPLIEAVFKVYSETSFFENANILLVKKEVEKELEKFLECLEKGIRLLENENKITAKIAFDMYQSFGVPFEITKELALKKGIKISEKEFNLIYEEHRNLSRSKSIGMFKGGLADNSEKVIAYHTATHLIHQALCDVFGPQIKQMGSNITGDRIRFDFSFDRKLTDGELKKIEEIVNNKIKERLKVYYLIMPFKKAISIGAKAYFKEKYPEKVKVYFIGGDKNEKDAYSIELCGGPHVENTSEIEPITIIKTEKIGKNIVRLYAK